MASWDGDVGQQKRKPGGRAVRRPGRPCGWWEWSKNDDLLNLELDNVEPIDRGRQLLLLVVTPQQCFDGMMDAEKRGEVRIHSFHGITSNLAADVSCGWFRQRAGRWSVASEGVVT